MSNNRKKNGYFGAYYWHPEHQPVVTAQRDRKLKNVGEFFTEVFCVVFENHVPQRGSANTFVYKVVEVLRIVNQENGASFQVFFTGHSSVGCSALITTFSTKYREIQGINFLKK